MKFYKRTIPVLVAIALLFVTVSCSKADTSSSTKKGTDSSTSTDKVALTLEEELKWMEFTRVAYFFVPQFNRNSELDEKALIDNMLLYFILEYRETDRSKFALQSADGIVIKEEAVDMLSERFLGRKVKQHQSVDYVRYEAGNYYVGPLSIHGAWRSYIKSFTNNSDGTVTVEFDIYYANEDDYDNAVIKLTLEEFAKEMRKDPQKFGKPQSKGKLTLKKVVDSGVERYIIIENISTPL
jgi:hypothetical protein